MSLMAKGITVSIAGIQILMLGARGLTHGS